MSVYLLAVIVFGIVLVGCSGAIRPSPVFGPVVVAVVDTGGDPFFLLNAGLLQTNSGESEQLDGLDSDGNGYVDDYLGWDFVENDNNPYDWALATRPQLSGRPGRYSHGTAMASIVTSSREGNSPVRVLLARVATTEAPARPAVLSEALRYVVRARADVILVALGGDWTSELVAAVTHSGLAPSQVVVVAAGNGGFEISDTSPQGRMCLLDNIVCVGSADVSGRIWGSPTTASDFGRAVKVATGGGPVSADVSYVETIEPSDVSTLVRSGYLRSVGTCVALSQAGQVAFNPATGVPSAYGESSLLCPSLGASARVVTLEGTSVAAARVANGLARLGSQTGRSGAELVRELLAKAETHAWLARYVDHGRFYDGASK